MSTPSSLRIIRKPSLPMSIKRAKHAGKIEKPAAQKEYLLRIVLGNPRLDLIIQSLREGVSVSNLADWFVKERWVSQASSVIQQALYMFRKEYWEMINADDNNEGISTFVKANRPQFDPVMKLNQLYRLQEQRIAISHRNEKSIGVLMDSTVKEVGEAREILNSLAKITNPKQNDITVLNESSVTYEQLRKEELKSDTVYALTSTLANKVTRKNATAVTVSGNFDE